MKIKALAVVPCLLAAGAQAQILSSAPMMYSQPEFYLGLNYAQLQVDIENDVIDRVFSPDWNTLGLNLGVQPSPYLAFEVRYGKGVGDDDFSLSDGANTLRGSTELKHYYGAYALPQIPIQDFMSVYGLLGWSKGKAEIEVTELNNTPLNGTASDSEDDFSYGVGVRFRDIRTPNGVAFFAEYSQLINKGDYDINGMLLGLSWHF